MNTESIDLFRRRVRENTGCGDLLFGLITDTHFEEKDDPGGYGANGAYAPPRLRGGWGKPAARGSCFTPGI